MNAKQNPMPRPPNEPERLAALHRYRILDTDADADFDFLATLAAEIIGTPYAFVSLVDRDRAWFKASYGSDARWAPRDEDYCALAILDSSTLIVPDLLADPRTAHLPKTVEGPRYRMYTGAPLVTEDRFQIGALCVLDVKPRHLLERELELLQRLARQTMHLIELRAKRRELESAMRQLEHLAAIDPLTGLGNRRTLVTRLEEEIARSARYQSPLSVVLFDIDHFKSVNDSHGHAAGDAVLRNVAACLKTNTRVGDIAARYGGEEFCVVLPQTDARSAAVWSEGLRRKIAAMEHENGVRITGSFGIAAYHPTAAPEVESLLREADTALYAAKRQGRNRSVVACRQEGGVRHTVKRATLKAA